MDTAAPSDERAPYEHAPCNAMSDPDDVAQFYDLCSDLMRELLDRLARAPGVRRPFGDVEDDLAWPRRRIASMLGGVSRLRVGAFDGRRPYHLGDDRWTDSGRWEIWVDGEQAIAIREARRGWTHAERRRAPGRRSG